MPDTIVRCSCCNRRVSRCVCELPDPVKLKAPTNDEKLRAVGCSIHSRPNKGPDLWRLPEDRDGKIVSTENALFEMVDELLKCK